MEKIKSPLKAIRAYCTDCSGNSVSERKNCVIEDCAIYPFRNGKNPFRQSAILTDEQKRKRAERMSKVGKERNREN